MDLAAVNVEFERTSGTPSNEVLTHENKTARLFAILLIL